MYIKYNEFLCGIEKYFELYNNGLKKQANIYIKNFVNDFEENVPESEHDEILCRLCREMLDENKHENFTKRGNGSLPYEINKLLWNYLKHECELEKMPQMRWIFELYNTHYNPFDPKGEYSTYKILEKAYNHSECDQKTVDLYFCEQLKWLEWGAHHFPEGCIITKESYKETVKTAEKIISEKYVCSYFKEALEYFLKLYNCFYKYEDFGEDFYNLCEDEKIKFPTYW